MDEEDLKVLEKIDRELNGPLIETPSILAPSVLEELEKIDIELNGPSTPTVGVRVNTPKPTKPRKPSDESFGHLEIRRRDGCTKPRKQKKRGKLFFLDQPVDLP